MSLFDDNDAPYEVEYEGGGLSDPLWSPADAIAEGRALAGPGEKWTVYDRRGYIVATGRGRSQTG